jgi:hypothetical protein
MSEKHEGHASLSDKIFIKKTTAMVPKGISIPCKDIPSSRLLEIKNYPAQGWVLVYLDKATWSELETLIQKRGLDPRKVVFGTLMKLKDQLKAEEGPVPPERDPRPGREEEDERWDQRQERDPE